MRFTRLIALDQLRSTQKLDAASPHPIHFFYGVDELREAADFDSLNLRSDGELDVETHSLTKICGITLAFVSTESKTPLTGTGFLMEGVVA